MPPHEPRTDTAPRSRADLLVAIEKYLREVENDVRFVGEPNDVGWHEMHRALVALVRTDDITTPGLDLIARELDLVVGSTESDS